MRGAGYHCLRPGYRLFDKSSELERYVVLFVTRAVRLGDPDYGEPLPERRDDELSELAGIFNSMRERLRATTMSRDYVDSVLASMSDAIIVTTHDGIVFNVDFDPTGRFLATASADTTVNLWEVGTWEHVAHITCTTITTTTTTGTGSGITVASSAVAMVVAFSTSIACPRMFGIL